MPTEGCISSVVDLSSSSSMSDSSSTADQVESSLDHSLMIDTAADCSIDLRIETKKSGDKLLNRHSFSSCSEESRDQHEEEEENPECHGQAVTVAGGKWSATSSASGGAQSSLGRPQFSKCHSPESEMSSSIGIQFGKHQALKDYSIESIIASEHQRTSSQQDRSSPPSSVIMGKH